MANRDYVRDAAGRFARTMTAAAKKAAKEEAEDAKRVAKARLAEQVSVAKASLAEAQKALTATDRLKEDAHTDSEFLDWEIARKKARDGVRRARLKLDALKVAAKGAAKL